MKNGGLVFHIVYCTKVLSLPVEPVFTSQRRSFAGLALCVPGTAQKPDSAKCKHSVACRNVGNTVMACRSHTSLLFDSVFKANDKIVINYWNFCNLFRILPLSFQSRFDLLQVYVAGSHLYRSISQQLRPQLYMHWSSKIFKTNFCGCYLCCSHWEWASVIYYICSLPLK